MSIRLSYARLARAVTSAVRGEKAPTGWERFFEGRPSPEGSAGVVTIETPLSIQHALGIVTGFDNEVERIAAEVARLRTQIAVLEERGSEASRAALENRDFILESLSDLVREEHPAFEGKKGTFRLVAGGKIEFIPAPETKPAEAPVPPPPTD